MSGENTRPTGSPAPRTCWHPRRRAVMTARPARILAAAAGLTAAAPAGLAAALINAAIVRKPPPSDETASQAAPAPSIRWRLTRL